jgi:hypothetical protein
MIRTLPSTYIASSIFEKILSKTPSQNSVPGFSQIMTEWFEKLIA